MRCFEGIAFLSRLCLKLIERGLGGNVGGSAAGRQCLLYVLSWFGIERLYLEQNLFQVLECKIRMNRDESYLPFSQSETRTENRVRLDCKNDISYNSQQDIRRRSRIMIMLFVIVRYSIGWLKKCRVIVNSKNGVHLKLSSKMLGCLHSNYGYISVIKTLTKIDYRFQEEN